MTDSTGGSCTYVHTDISTSSLEEPWQCPHDAVEGREQCVFHHSAAEREEVGLSERDVQRRFTAALDSGDPDRRAFVGATLPGLDFDHIDFDHDDQHLLDLRHTRIRGDFVASYARFEEAVDLRDAKLGAFRADAVSFSDGLLCRRATFEGEVDCYGGTFTGDDVVFTGATFEAAVRFDQATFADAAAFDDVTFSDEATFLGTEFHGRSIDIGDYTSFEGATFEDVARFDYTQFEATSFEETQFTDTAHFGEATTTAPVRFDRATFESAADFDGSTFGDDVSFATAAFEGEAQFRGVTFDGGGTMLHEDADFSAVHFGRAVSFESGQVGAATFEAVVFDADACFRDVAFRENACFDAAQFAGEARFDEATFDARASFEGVTFAAVASYPGVEFRGSNNHDSASVTFDDVVFGGDANFHHVSCTAASFRNVRFEGDACFVESKFLKHIDMKVGRIGVDTPVDFTEARLAAGAVVQPEHSWVRYDLTKATVGDIVFRVEGTENRDLFRYLRFCETKFEGFDFMAHAHYLTRSDWRLHDFDDDGLEHEYAVETTPQAIEKTYQRAKISASEMGNVEASGKFRFKRQQYARKSYQDIASDPEESVGTRIRNGQRVGENLFLGITCGHGMRLYRIAAMFAFFPVGPALLYTFGGPRFRTGAGQIYSLVELSTVGGIETFAANLHFSYITFLTIGYGNVVAEGMLGLVMVSIEAYASVVLGGLFIYALVKRSEL
ncbi:pentapeptide repeat-containing protein [Halosimplex salinum]|uniref:pentapeptide repeat-containing protein n=1 Tax=Halosimplex salinum TaxID=1710538 RepID=UPI000F4A49AC|nr:pentapeptide repeat-containing protein [Halosimplex salinum]